MSLARWVPPTMTWNICGWCGNPTTLAVDDGADRWGNRLQRPICLPCWNGRYGPRFPTAAGSDPT